MVQVFFKRKYYSTYPAGNYWEVYVYEPQNMVWEPRSASNEIAPARRYFPPDAQDVPLAQLSFLILFYDIPITGPYPEVSVWNIATQTATVETNVSEDRVQQLSLDPNYTLCMLSPANEVRGRIDSYSFEQTVKPDTPSDFSVIVSNVGNIPGQVFVVISNLSGNPGAISVVWEGVESLISPGSLIALRPTTNIDVGKTFTASSTIKYHAEGTYNIRIEAWHKNPVTNVDEGPDDIKVLTVTATTLKGTLECHAYVNSEEVSANVEVVGVGTYTTPFTITLDAGDYTLNATYNTQTQTQTAHIVEGETTRVDFKFVKVAPPTAPPLVTGPLGLWSFPLLTRLAELFPAVRRLLSLITQRTK